MTLTPGTRLGPYEIVAAIGAGGMGEVHKARDSRLGRDVAIKVLPPSFAADTDRRARFEREAKAVAALSHPNVIAIFDTGVHGDQLYVVMELLTGQTLRQRLASSPMPVRKAVDIAIQIARGLGAAHAKGLVHRDLKPENIFLLEDGQVKILDFGLARQTTDAAHAGTTEIALTGEGTVMGTVGYMAPEQVRGHAVDARADVFAFGAVLYEMVSGQRAFQRDTTADSMTAILTHDPPELVGSRPDLSPALDRIIRHCFEKNANERFQSVHDIAFALDALSGSATSGSSGGTATIPSSEPVGRPRAALLKVAAVAGALLLVLAAGAGYFGRGVPASPFAAASEVSYRPVTFESGFVFAARFAPDGRTIAYSADWDQQPRGVYVTSLDSLEYRPLGFPGADLLGISKFGELAVLSGSAISGSPYLRIGTLAKGSMTGGSSRAELEGVTFADFGSDGAMAVVRLVGRRTTVEYPVGHVLVEGEVTGFRGLFSAPRVSPSGEHIAFFDMHVPAEFAVKIFNKAGIQVAQSRTITDWAGLAWTPANELWFAATETAGSQTAIFGLDLAGKERPIWRAPGGISLHDISPQGDVLLSFDRARVRTELVDGARSSPIDRSWREAGRVAALSNNHALLINGMGDSAGPKGSVYAWLPGETQAVRIADGTGLALSPDGKKALIMAKHPPLKVWVVPTGAGQPTLLDVGPVDGVNWAGWLPDGRIVLQSRRKGEAVMVSVISAEGGAPTRLLPPGTTLGFPGPNLVSPTGRLIAAVDEQSRIVVCTASAPATCRQVPGAGSHDIVAGWTADGKSLVTHHGEVGSAQIDHLDITTGRRVAYMTLRPLATALSGFGRVIAAPDGAIAYYYGRDDSQLYVIKGLK